MKILFHPCEDLHLHLQNGEICCLPTDTTWGLSCNSTNMNTITRLFYLKKRRGDKSLPVFVPSIEVATQHFEINSLAEKLISRYWPGKLTLLLPRKQINPLVYNYIHTSISNSDIKVAVRMPGNSRSLESMKQSTVIACTSANFSGFDPAPSLHILKKQMEAHHASVDNDDINLYYNTLDKELVLHKIPSTILDITDDKKINLIREGAIKYTEIMSYIKECGLL
ncbi:L-threonylcarbamoyladenylate synthase [Candidatus Fokinia crypta]|uniref:L-threonylcarbamoyladenylate synthase n=1 Tax=Candidatus Fokinia crypta TaxID=1920990 RepID=A0ABZ0URI6_9RICK|nr:L-threonylcarbamoyladenylate synthase [Candidatus Fokinia cryptica]WPX97758.1 Putative yrdC-domain threonylcarbamoyl-AMP synthase [Candidatus Fokinia cryptica]